jgi:hypothetical protein
VNKVFVRLGNEPMPTTQRDIDTRLLPPSENRHFSNQKLVEVHSHMTTLSLSLSLSLSHHDVYHCVCIRRVTSHMSQEP